MSTDPNTNLDFGGFLDRSSRPDSRLLVRSSGDSVGRNEVPRVFVAWETDRGEDCAARERPGDGNLAGAVRGAVHAADMVECGGTGDGGVAVSEPPHGLRGRAGGGWRVGHGFQPVPSVLVARGMVGPARLKDLAWPAG